MSLIILIQPAFADLYPVEMGAVRVAQRADDEAGRCIFWRIDQIAARWSAAALISAGGIGRQDVVGHELSAAGHPDPDVPS